MMDSNRTAPAPEQGATGLPMPVAAISPVPVLTDEQLRNIESLLDYVAEAGLDKEGSLLAATLEALAAFRAAAKGDTAALLGAGKELLRLYVQLGALTGANGITGRSIRSSAASQKHLGWMRLLGIGLVACAVAAEVAGEAGLGAPVQRLSAQLVPMLWGSLGAIVFLLKTITDRASDLTFDERKLQGLPERILLGGLCGTILVNLFGVVGEGLTGAAVGFLAGLGTKAVYAAFETAVNALAERVGMKKSGG